MEFRFGRRALLTPALAMSVAIHTFGVVLALSTPEHLAPPQTHPAAPPPPRARVIAYVAITPPLPRTNLVRATQPRAAQPPATHLRAAHPGTARSSAAPHSAPAPNPPAPKRAEPAQPVAVRQVAQPAPARQPPPEPHALPITVVRLDPSDQPVGIPSLTPGLGFRVPSGTAGQDGVADALGSAGERGTMIVAELITGAGTACPELRLPQHWPTGAANVTVAFVVDTRGDVDPATLRVVESPERPRRESRFYSHIYAVATNAREDRGLPDAGMAYDSVVTRDVLQHVRSLEFHPALRDGRPTRSTVLVSCQTT